MHFLLAPDAFKGSLTSHQAAAAMSAGIRQAVPEAEVVCHPLADGGEGTLDVLLPHLHGNLESFGDHGQSWQYGVYKNTCGETVALIESARLIGLTLPDMQQFPVERRNSAALGKAISHALAQEISHFVIGLGGTATNDGGIGMLSALGMQCMDAAGKAVPPTLSGLTQVAEIDFSDMDQRLFASEFTVLSDVFNPLCGPDGATAVFGPQKGISGQMVAHFDAAMRRWGQLCESAFDVHVIDEEGAGAAGGLGFALLLLGGRMVSGADDVIGKSGFHGQACKADWVITGEGKSDAQTLDGKLPLKVSEHAKKTGTQVALLSGDIDEGALESLSRHFDLMAVARPPAMAMDDAMRQAADLLQEAAGTLARRMIDDGY